MRGEGVLTFCVYLLITKLKSFKGVKHESFSHPPTVPRQYKLIPLLLLGVVLTLIVPSWVEEDIQT